MGGGNETAVADRSFLKRVGQLRRLRDFIVSEGIEVPDDTKPKLYLGPLSALHFSRAGRNLSAAEWDGLDERYCALFGLLPPDSRKKYVLREYPFAITIVAVAALVLSILAFFSAIFPSGLAYICFHAYDPTDAATALPVAWMSSAALFSFILWVVCLSALGSVAFISVNALSIQNDATFDITNAKFVSLRVVLGILFGVIITLPSSYQSFRDFTAAMGKIVGAVLPAVTSATAATPGISVTQVAVLILPFLIGFSASLFMAVINRMVSGIQTMFGIDGRPQGGPAMAPGGSASSAGGAGPVAAVAPHSILGASSTGQSIL